MGIFRLSHLAEADLDEITRHTLRQWGEEQTIRYLDAIEERYGQLAENSSPGPRCDSIRPGLWRTEQGSHVIFFGRVSRGIRVIRVMRRRTLPEIHESDEDES